MRAILDAVRSALGRVPGAPVPPPPPLAPPPTGQPAERPAEQLARFVDRLRAVGGRCERAADADTAAAAVFAALTAAGARSAVLGDAPEVQAIAARLRAAGIACLPPDAPRDQLLAAGAGVTTAFAAIAETGTLVLGAQHERSRLASLLPPLHVCLLPAGRVLPTLARALESLPRPLPHAVTFVTGPSRTADIELQLVIGVHGPRDLLVVLVDGA
jgi:L-lactate dehydrogenase complex protein LldG